MSTILTRLSTDHRNMAYLLGLFETHVARVAEGDDSGLELLHEIVRYMRRYADHTHHPVEDAMYAKMLQVMPERCEGLEFVAEQHAALEAAAMQLDNLYARALGGDVVIRAALVAASTGFVESLRGHMAMENDRFFVLANEALEKHDWSDIEETLSKQSDPIFGSILEEDFRQLYILIKEESENPGQALPNPLAGS